jgi:hypothetical protein
MTQLGIFDDRQLISYWKVAFSRHCLDETRVDGALTLRFRDVSGITWHAGERTMEVLSQQLRTLETISNVSAEEEWLADILASIAIIAGHADIKVIGPLEPSVRLDLLRRSITRDFALICALSLARARGHTISLEEVTRQVAYPALLARDQDSIALIFRTLLGTPQPASGPRQVRRYQRAPRRELSAKSYWNLVSVGEVENWDDSVKLRLIEEYLSPAPHPHLISYINDDVSGDEWRELYRWIYRDDRHIP